MLTENEVIAIVICHLEKSGYKKISTSNTVQQGHDIVATKGNSHIYIEAKGETSSKANTNRFGKGFDSSQTKDHVAKAIYKAIETKSDHPQGIVGIALPDNQRQRDLVNRVLPSLKDLGIVVFFANEDGKVDVLNEHG